MKLRSLFRDYEIKDAIECSTRAETGTVNYSEVAQMLSDTERCLVSPQLARYWCRQFEIHKQNGTDYITLAVADRQLKQGREVIVPNLNDTAAKVDQPTDSTCILFITDTHAPYQHPDTIPFLQAVNDTYKPTMIIHGGDEVDNHALSFHTSDPNLDSAGPELEQARLFLAELHEMFPLMRICESNHGSLIYRRAKAHGIPVQYLKTYRDILFPDGGGEGWSWHEVIRIQMHSGRDLQFQHQCNGDILKGAAHENANLFVGHEHSKFGIGYGASTHDTYYSVYGGCLLDTKAMAFSYGKLFVNKPIVGCVLVNNGIPVCIPMMLDKYNRWTGAVYENI